jgi:hypothetical protein
MIGKINTVAGFKGFFLNPVNKRASNFYVRLQKKLFG